MDTIFSNHNRIQQTIMQSIKNNSFHENPQVIVVSKQQSLEDISKLYDIGYRHFAENRIEELLFKKTNLPQDITWHFIGTLQTRKVKKIINDVDYCHSLDRYTLIDEIEKRAKQRVSCFLQVNVFEEEQKHGFSIDDIDHVLHYVSQLAHITVVGFMIMTPYKADETTIINGFEKIKHLQLYYKNKGIKNCPCQFLSMGMSQDYDLAAQYGATHLRIGSAFFE